MERASKRERHTHAHTHTHTHANVHTARAHTQKRIHTHTHTHTHTAGKFQEGGKERGRRPDSIEEFLNVDCVITEGTQVVVEEGALVEIHADDPEVINRLKDAGAWIAPGARWKEIGPAKPASGTEIQNPQLVTALLQEQEFSQADVERLVKGAGLSYRRYANVNRPLLLHT
jgi:hypothetical protein